MIGGVCVIFSLFGKVNPDLLVCATQPAGLDIGRLAKAVGPAPGGQDQSRAESGGGGFVRYSTKMTLTASSGPSCARQEWI